MGAAVSYLTFSLYGTSPSGKTEVWDVLSDAGSILGQVSWFGRWRCYAFFPASKTVFERLCLLDLAAFCERETARRREHRKTATMINRAAREAQRQ